LPLTRGLQNRNTEMVSAFETARRARAEEAKVILTARNPERLRQAASEVETQNPATFDATDPVALERFFFATRQ